MSYFDDQVGGGTPAASLKLKQVGAGFWGTVESVSLVDQKKYNSDEYVVDAAGNKVQQLRIILAGNADNYATASKALTSEEGQPLPDDGRRAVYVPKNTNLSFRTAEALAAAGKLSEGVEVGGMLSIQYTEDIPTNKGNPARGHEVRYKAPEPKPQSSGAHFADQVQQQAAPPQQPQQPAAPPQQAPQQPAAPPQQAPQQQGFPAPSSEPPF